MTSWHKVADEESNTQAVIDRCGWCVRYPDGTWLGCAHGLFKAPNPFYAYNFDSKEKAEKFRLEGLEEQADYYVDGEVVVGYEYYIAHLEHEISNYQEYTGKTSKEILDIIMGELLDEW